MNKYNFTFLILFLFISLAFAQPRQDYALFFVVMDFDNWANFPQSSEQQVREIEQELQSNYGFQTEFVSNPTRRQVLDKLDEYQRKSFGEDDQLLIYFSMHGEYKEGGTGALIPKDGQLKDKYGDSWIRHPLLADLTNDIDCEHILLAIDACYSGTFGGSRGMPSGAAFRKKGDCQYKIGQALKYKSRQYATSGGAERTPTDSQFADKWLEALRVRNTDGILNYAELFGVLHDAYPRPMHGEFKDHMKGGDFIFVNKNACSSIRTKTDEEDWNSIEANFNIERIFEHIRNYPNCIHEKKIGEIIAGNSLTIKTDKKDSKIVQSEKKRKNKTPATKNSNGVHDGKPIMVRVEGGTFKMGCTSEQSDCEEDETPVHSVTVNSFSISKYEITNEQYARFLNEKNGDVSEYLEPGKYRRLEYKWSKFRAKAGFEKHPITDMTFEGAKAFAEYYGMRLPTEAEWEFAARGGTKGKGYKYAGSNTIKEVAFYHENSGNSFKKVGTKLPNELGIHDMSGNVWEYCSDLYSSKYYRKVKNGATNPVGPNNGDGYVLRGGSSKSTENDCRISNRKYFPKVAFFSSFDMGFRVVKD